MIFFADTCIVNGMRKFILGIIFLFLILSPGLIFAQEPAIEIVNNYQITDSQAVDGDIITSTGKGLVRATVPYDSSIFGVLVDTALEAYREAGTTNKLVARYGTVSVSVTNFNGDVKTGDLVTSSEIAGKGQKANLSGYVLGRALSDFKSAGNLDYKGKQYQTGKIPVALRIEYAEISSPQSFKRFFDLLGGAFFSNLKDPNRFGQIVRYIAAALIILIALIVALFILMRSVPKAIEAIGRNPLAKTSIYISMVINLILVILIIGLGILASVIILRV